MNRTPETQRGQRLYFQRRPIREKASEKPVFSLSLWMYRSPNRYAQLKTRRTYTAPIDMRVGRTTNIARDRSTNGWTCFRLFVAGWENTYRIDGSPAECKGDRKSWDKDEVSLENIRYECIERRDQKWVLVKRLSTRDCSPSEAELNWIITVWRKGLKVKDEWTTH